MNRYAEHQGKCLPIPFVQSIYYWMKKINQPRSTNQIKQLSAQKQNFAV
jgi:hypothetical protein